MDDSYFDVAQICRNGHVINSMARDYPTGNQDYCSKCGAPTTTTCEQCGAEIRGWHHIPGVFGVGSYHRPGFCHKCGTGFPWTSTGLAAARELADTIEGLPTEDREDLKTTLEDLVRDSPKTPVAETRFKKIMKHSGKETVEGMKAVLIDIVSETVRRSLFGA